MPCSTWIRSEGWRPGVGSTKWRRWSDCPSWDITPRFRRWGSCRLWVPAIAGCRSPTSYRLPALHDQLNRARIPDIEQRIGSQHHQIGHLADLDGAAETLGPEHGRG